MDKLSVPRAAGGVGTFTQTCALAAIAILAGLSGGLTLLSVFGVTPWLTLAAGFGDMPLPHAGIAVQVGIAALCVGLCFFLPASRRIMRY